MNPITGVIRNRAKAGMTIPAAPRMVSVSLNAGVMWNSPAMAPKSMGESACHRPRKIRFQCRISSVSVATP